MCQAVSTRRNIAAGCGRKEVKGKTRSSRSAAWEGSRQAGACGRRHLYCCNKLQAHGSCKLCAVPARRGAGCSCSRQRTPRLRLALQRLCAGTTTAHGTAAYYAATGLEASIRAHFRLVWLQAHEPACRVLIRQHEAAQRAHAGAGPHGRPRHGAGNLCESGAGGLACKGAERRGGRAGSAAQQTV